MLPKHLFDRATSATHPNANQPIGTGPFKFVEWRRGEFVRLDKNRDYWRKGLPYLDRIVVRFINDDATRTAALEKGEAHVAGFGGVPYNDAKKLATLPTIEVTTKGYEMISPVVETGDQHQEGTVRQAEGAPGHRLRDRPPVHHRQHLVRLRQAGDRAARAPTSRRRASTPPTSPSTRCRTASTAPTSCSTTPALKRGATASASRSCTTSRPTAESGSASASSCSSALAPGRHQGDAALRGRGDLAQARLHRLRFRHHRRTSSTICPIRCSACTGHPRQADQAGHGVRERLAVERTRARRADGQGHDRARSQEARRSTMHEVQKIVVEDSPHRLGVRAATSQHRTTSVPRRDHQSRSASTPTSFDRAWMDIAMAAGCRSRAAETGTRRLLNL